MALSTSPLGTFTDFLRYSPKLVNWKFLGSLNTKMTLGKTSGLPQCQGRCHRRHLQEIFNNSPSKTFKIVIEGLLKALNTNVWHLSKQTSFFVKE